MAESRALLTERERDIISEESEVDDKYRYETISRVRSRIDRLQEDAKILAAHRPDLLEKLEIAVSDVAKIDVIVPHHVVGIPGGLLGIIDDELPSKWRSSELSAARIQHLVAEFILQGTGPNNPDTIYILKEGEFSFENVQKREKKAMKDVARTLDRDRFVGGPANVGNLRNTAHSNLFSDTPASQFRDALVTIEDRFHEAGLSLEEYQDEH
jgi:hypothetical protein